MLSNSDNTPCRDGVRVLLSLWPGGVLPSRRAVRIAFYDSAAARAGHVRRPDKAFELCWVVKDSERVRTLEDFWTFKKANHDNCAVKDKGGGLFEGEFCWLENDLPVAAGWGNETGVG